MHKLDGDKITIGYDFVFPNFVVPNALQTDITIVNYLSSIYASKSHSSTVLEQNGSQVLGDIFGDDMRFKQNSITGTFFLTKLCQDKINVNQNSVYFLNENYIYPIRTISLDRLNGYDNIGTKKGFGNYFWKYISPRVMEDLKNGKAKLLIDMASEQKFDKREVLNLNKCLSFSDIPKESVHLVINSFNAKELYEQYCSPNDRKFNVVNYPFLMDMTAQFFDEAQKDCPQVLFDYDDFKKSKQRVRKYHFLMKSRHARTHRLFIFLSLIRDKKISLGHFSFLKQHCDMNTVDYIIKKYGIENIDLNSVRKFLDNGPYVLSGETENIIIGAIGNQYEHNLSSPYQKCYFDIVTDSEFDTKDLYFSEKIWKPMVNFLPFVLSSNKGCLKLLRDLGFKTFHPFIDESYDDVVDDIERLKMVYNEVYKLCNMSIEELHKWYWSLEDILEYNKNHFLNIYKHNSHTERVLSYFKDIFSK